MILIKPLSLGLSMLYISRGLILDFPNAALVAFLMKELKRYARKYRCLFITFNPAAYCNDYIIKEANDNHHEHVNAMIQMLQDQGAVFKGFARHIDDTIQSRYRANVYACDDFNATLYKGCRKVLQTVQKKMIEVLPYHMDGVEDSARVMRCTGERKNIHLWDQEYFQRLMEIYSEDAVTFLVKLSLRRPYGGTKQRCEQNERDLTRCLENAKKKRFILKEPHASLSREVEELQENLERDGDIAVISGALCAKFGPIAEILYAGMDKCYKRYMAPYASFYSCMTRSFEKDYHWNNTGGIEDSLKGGLTKFKANHNPTINKFIGEFDLPVYKPPYVLSQWAMKQGEKALQKK